MCDITNMESYHTKWAQCLTLKNNWRKFKNLIVWDTLYYSVLVVCILLVKIDFIMASVIQVSDVVYGPFVYTFYNSKTQ